MSHVLHAAHVPMVPQRSGEDPFWKICLLPMIINHGVGVRKATDAVCDRVDRDEPLIEESMQLLGQHQAIIRTIIRR